MTFDVKHLTQDSVHSPCFCVFDIIFLNDKILTNVSLKERLTLLKTVFKEEVGVIILSKFFEAKSKWDIVDALNQSMDRNEEGIVFKDPDSSYIPNSRKSGWWKMKSEVIYLFF